MAEFESYEHFKKPSKSTSSKESESTSDENSKKMPVKQKVHKCPECNKEYKLLTYYAKHLKSHQDPPAHFTDDEVAAMMNNAKCNLKKSNLYEEEVMNVIDSCDTPPCLVDNLNRFLQLNYNSDMFQANFCKEFPSLFSINEYDAMILCIELCVELRGRLKKRELGTEDLIEPKPITDRDIKIIVYLAGYSFQKKWSQIRFNKRTDYQLPQQQEKWYVIDSVVEMFKSVEMRVREELATLTTKRRLCDISIANSLFEEDYMTSMVSFLEETSGVPEALCSNILQNAIRRYIRVRVYGYVKLLNDGVNPSKGLRSGLLAGASSSKKARR